MTKLHVLQFRIAGMDCMEEVAVLHQAVGPIVGGDDRLTFDILNGCMTVHSNDETVTPSVVMEAVAETGMRT